MLPRADKQYRALYESTTEANKNTSPSENINSITLFRSRKLPDRYWPWVFHCPGQSAVSRCIAEVTDAMIERLLNTWIKFPNSVEASQAAKRGFAEIDAAFPHLIGVVDGTQVRIIAPRANHPIHPGQPYYCRKKFYAIITQIIGDSNRKIININARFPGSVHDAAIWMTSRAKRSIQREYVQNGSVDYLLGNSG